MVSERAFRLINLDKEKSMLVSLGLSRNSKFLGSAGSRLYAKIWRRMASNGDRRISGIGKSIKWLNSI